MELVYCWIDNNESNLKDIELNFSGEYTLKYDKLDKRLYITKNKNYIKNFFNKENDNTIKSITGIVGKNGSGKSSILEYIKGYFYDGGILCNKIENSYIFNKSLLVVNDRDKLIIFANDELLDDENNVIYDKSIEVSTVLYGNKNIEKFKNYIKIGKNLRKISGSEILQDIACVYMSNIFDMDTPNYNSDIKNGYYDISTNGILDELEKGLITIDNGINYKPVFINEEPGEVSNKFKISSTRRFKLYRTLQQIKYISDSIENYEYINKTKFKLPDELIISTDCNYKRATLPRFFTEDSQLLRCENEGSIIEIEDLIYKKLEWNIAGCDDQVIRDKFIVYKTLINRTITSYFNDIQRIIPNTQTYREKLSENMQKIYNDNLIDKDIIELINIINENMINTIEELKNLDTSFIKFNKGKDPYEGIKHIHESYCEFILEIEKIIFNSEYTYSYVYNQVSNIKSLDGTYNGIYKEEGNLNFKINEKSLDEINKLINLYIKLDSTQDFMMFMWRNISSGEYTLLDTYAKLYSLKEKIKQENIILIIDEGELYLHPEWQRQYIDILVEYIPKIYKNKNVQIILASNSPFLISDIPRTNLIVMDKEDNKIKVSNNSLVRQTFGANISKLLGDTFFMNNTMGVFARYKINDVLDILKGDIDLEKKEYIRNVIDLIEEPIIKIKLKEIYNDKYGNVEDEIKYIDENIEKLIEKKKKLQSKTNQNNGEVNDKN